MNPVAVILPTYRRPDSLERALRSVLAQDGLSALAAEIAVVDNDPDGSARAAVARLQQEGAAPLPVPVLYVQAHEPGVSNARNAGLAATAAPLVAFIDDDEEAPPHWLAALHAAHTRLGVDVAFGPVRGRADAAAAWKRTYLERFFSREGSADTGVTDQVYGCGNTMMTRAAALRGPAPFDVAANQTGGEDDRLFAKLRAEGRRFGWAAEAWLWEHAPANRLSARYALGRAFAFGQSPSQISARARQWGSVARWMAIGAAQATVFGALALVLAPFSPARALPQADKAMRGLGKLIWFKTLRFYGGAAAPSSPASAMRSPAASLNATAAKITQ
jgi:hypothetical protein